MANLRIEHMLWCIGSQMEVMMMKTLNYVGISVSFVHVANCNQYSVSKSSHKKVAQVIEMYGKNFK